MVRWVVCACAIVLFIVACGPSVAPVYCTPDETMCHGSCSALYKDPENCGACDHACPGALVCSQGACATSCSGGTLQCGQSCVELYIDRRNCGACGVVCGPGEACLGGACTSTCAVAQRLCVVGTQAYCASTFTDNVNCGDCGVACGAGKACINGNCMTPCGATQTECGVYCADLASDHDNCGGCGTTCLSNQFCENGGCVCPAGESVCGATCVDLATSNTNCGSCNTKCTGSCTGGRCEISVTSTTDAGQAIVVDAARVYWTETSGSVFQSTKNGTQVEQLASNVAIDSLAVDASNVYWPAGATVGFVPIGGGTPETQSLPNGSDAREVVTDGSFVYVASTNAILRFPSGGGIVETLVSGESPHALAVHSGTLVWANDSFALRTAALDGSNAKTLTTMSSEIGDVATDGANAYFVWNAVSILSIPLDGSAPALILVNDGSSVSRLACDTQSVYWLDATSLSKIPIGGGSSAALASTGPTATHLALDTYDVFWTSVTDVMKLGPK